MIVSLGRQMSAAVGLVITCAAYACLRLAMTREFSGAPWKALVALEAPLPFGHRVLLPLLARPVVGSGWSLQSAWLLTETLATVFALASFEYAARAWLPRRPARLAAFTFLLALSLPFLLAHKWPIFYPWDTPALGFIACGVGAAARRSWGLAILCTLVGAANRETAVLIPASVAVLALGGPVLVFGESRDEPPGAEPSAVRNRSFAFAGLMFTGFVLIRTSIALALPDLPGAPADLRLHDTWRFVNNLRWLQSPAHAAQWLGSVAYTPLLVMLLWRFIPSEPRRLLHLAWAGALGLTFVGNVYEPRVYGEVLVLTWLPLSLGLWHWLQELSPADVRPPWLRRFDRLTPALLFAAACMVGIALLRCG